MKIKHSISIHLFSLFLFLSSRAIAQNTVQKIELKIVPFFISFSKFDPLSSDMDSVAALTTDIHDSYLLHFSNDKFYKILQSLKDSEIPEATVTDFRVRCTIFLISGKTEVLYMNVLGEFLYKDRYYKNSQVKKFIFDHVPRAYKD